MHRSLPSDNRRATTAIASQSCRPEHCGDGVVGSAFGGRKFGDRPCEDASAEADLYGRRRDVIAVMIKPKCARKRLDPRFALSVSPHHYANSFLHPFATYQHPCAMLYPHARHIDRQHEEKRRNGVLHGG